MNPARNSSLWLATSTSEGASRNVCPKSLLIRIKVLLTAYCFLLSAYCLLTPDPESLIPTQELQHQPVELVRFLPKWHVPYAPHDFEPGVRDLLGHQLPMFQRDHMVLLAPDDEGWQVQQFQVVAYAGIAQHVQALAPGPALQRHSEK